MKKKSKKTKSKVKAKKKVKAKARPKAKKVKAKKAAAKAKAKKAVAQKPKMSVIPPPNSVLVGRVEDYYAQIGVIAFTVKKAFRVGDRMQVLGHTSNVEQTVDSMQINHQSVTDARVGDAVGIKVNSRVRRGDYVFILLG